MSLSGAGRSLGKFQCNDVKLAAGNKGERDRGKEKEREKGLMLCSRVGRLFIIHAMFEIQQQFSYE